MLLIHVHVDLGGPGLDVSILIVLEPQTVMIMVCVMMVKTHLSAGNIFNDHSLKYFEENYFI